MAANGGTADSGAVGGAEAEPKDAMEAARVFCFQTKPEKLAVAKVKVPCNQKGDLVTWTVLDHGEDIIENIRKLIEPQLRTST